MALVAKTKFELEEVVAEIEGRPVHGGATHTYNEGDSVSKSELKAGGQSDEQIADLIARGVIGDAE